MPYCYDYPHPAVGTDILLFSKEKETTYILLIQRDKDPYEGRWAFPGGFVEENESCEQAAARELMEETGLQSIEVEQLGAFSDPNRDPRGWTITVAFVGWADRNQVKVQAGDDARNAKWFPILDVPPLAFDHPEILQKAIKKHRLLS